MKKMWAEPKIAVQEFVPNEYVAACWQVECRVGYGNYGGYGSEQRWRMWGYQRPYGDACDDHRGSCSIASNNQFNVDEYGNVSFFAENSSEQGSLNGGYTGTIDVNGNNIIDDGDLIFWYTLSGNEDRRWNHYGRVSNISAGHPNRS